MSDAQDIDDVPDRCRLCDPLCEEIAHVSEIIHPFCLNPIEATILLIMILIIILSNAHPSFLLSVIATTVLEPMR